jgi:hypothetical protein
VINLVTYLHCCLEAIFLETMLAPVSRRVWQPRLQIK